MNLAVSTTGRGLTIDQLTVSELFLNFNLPTVIEQR
jgi:hypothetical protein